LLVGVKNMNKFVDLNKRSKKAQKEFYKKQRVINGFNTGTRDMKTEKLPTRAMEKEKIRKEVNDYDNRS